MANVFRAGPLPVLDPKMQQLLGEGHEPMERVEARASELFPDDPPIVWECDASSFRFSYVGRRAEELLGFDRAAWLEPMFWADQVVHTNDRDDAVTYCSLATKKMRDHMFEYRAVSRDGQLVWLCDYVKVVRDAQGRPERLRGAMFDISTEKQTAGASHALRQNPSRDELATA